MSRWAKCEAFPDYSVSDEGQVRRDTSGRGARAGTTCKPWTDGKGRVSVSIRRDGKTITVRVATLVCTAFVGPKPHSTGQRMECCHNDGNPGNNRWGNVRWDTCRANKTDMLRHQTRRRGEAHWSTKISEAQVAEIRRRYAAGELQRVIGADYGISQAHVGRIANKVRRAHPAFRTEE